MPSLRACAEAGHDIALVVTQPDRAGDRGRPAPRPVKDAARELALTVGQPEKLRDPDAIAHLLAHAPDVLVVVAYGQILPSALLSGARLGGVNVHASLLPRWRGASPIAAAILAGDTKTGVSIMQMEAGLDTGPVYAMRSTPIAPGETAPQLSTRLASMGAEMLVEVLAALARGGAQATPQDDAQATYAPRLTRADAACNWASLSAVEVDRRVRAFDPWPGVLAPLAGQEVRILAGSVGDADTSTATPGTVVATSRTSIEVATREGAYRIDRLQPPGKRPMDAAAYLRGRRETVS